MSNGPFSSYTPPSVSTTTVVERNTPVPPTGLQIPIFIGTGQESLRVQDQELVRGSSSVVDQRVFNENVEGRFIIDETNPNNVILGDNEGLSYKFKVNNFPIVSGTGQGVTSFRTQDVSVTVDGMPVVVAAVDGVRGVVTLQVPPPEHSEVLVTYYYNRTDTLRTDDVSLQVDQSSAVIKASVVGPYEVIQGTSDTLQMNVDGVRRIITVSPGNTLTAQNIADDINQKVGFALASSEGDNQGNHRVVFTSGISIEILEGSINPGLGLNEGQRTSRNRSFVVFEGPIVDGSDGGITTNNIEDVQVTVNGVRTLPLHVDGSTRTVTLAQPPMAGSEVLITYYFNTYQDTYDVLPHRDITRVQRLGNAPGRSDYVEGLDYVIQGDKILWGSAVTVTEGNFTNAGTNEVFNADKVNTSLEDNTMRMEKVERYLNRSISPPQYSETEVVLSLVPTEGDERGKATTNPNHVRVFHGMNYATALLNEATVIKVDPVTRRVTLRDKIPAGHEVYATYEYNRLRDDTYILTRTQAGDVRVTSTTQGRDLWNVRVANTEVEQALVTGNGVNETVTLTIENGLGESAAVLINQNAGPYDFYTGKSDTLDLNINNATISVDLNTPGVATVVSEQIGDSGSIELGTVDTFEFTVDGDVVTVNLTTTPTTVASLAGEIQTALTNAGSTATASEENGRIVLKSNNPGVDSRIEIRNGNATRALGFIPLTTVMGSKNSINNPAEIEGSVVTVADFTDLNGKKFILTINGDHKEVEFTGYDNTTTLADVASDLETQLAPGAVVVANEPDPVGDPGVYDRLIITSTEDTSLSEISIGNGNATSDLGFVVGMVARRTQPTTSDLVATINAHLTTEAFADSVESLTGGRLVRITTYMEGDTESIVVEGGTSLNPYTGIGLNKGEGVIGTSGVSGYKVTTNNSNGSGKSPSDLHDVYGYVGQTYTDARTGLRFTLMPKDVPYQNGETIVLIVESVMKVGSSQVNRAIPGVRMFVSSLHAVAPNDSAVIQTYAKSGSEPNIGDFYYITYEHTKTDFTPKVFTNMEEVIAAHGELSPSNPLTLACYVAILNGASMIATKQVRKAPNSQQATREEFLNAVKEIEKPLSGGIKPSIIVPITTDLTVMGAVVKHCETQSSPRYANECRAIFGTASGTRPNDVIQIAKNLKSNRAMLVYPDTALVALTNVLGETTSYLVDGTYLAAAIAGISVSPLNDVATPLTRQRLVGFDRLNRSLDEIEMNQMAIHGVTLLTNKYPNLEIRHALTTDMTDRMSSTPSVIATVDYTQQMTRSALDRYIGLKHEVSRPQDIEVTLTGLLNHLVERKILVGFKGVSAIPDPNDPTMIRVRAMIAPIMPLLYIPVTFTISSSL